MNDERKYRCACGWDGHQSELVGCVVLRGDTGAEVEQIEVCPECLGISDTLTTCCDAPGCWDAATCGTPTPGGYRLTCEEHLPPRRQTTPGE